MSYVHQCSDTPGCKLSLCGCPYDMIPGAVVTCPTCMRLMQSAGPGNVRLVAMVAEKKPFLPLDSQARKDIPLCTGLLDYFPAALAAVAQVSKIGNDKHNPGQPLHHARSKSTDHANCILRHLAERGGIDTVTKVRHSAELAWRALALLQEELEREEGAPMPRGASES